MLKFESSLWLGVKCLRMTWFRMRFALLTLASVIANFTVIVALLAGESLPLIVAPLSVIVAVAFTATVFHLVRWSSQELGLLKALGARKATLTVAVLFQLVFLGVASTFLGLVIGLPLTLYLAGMRSLANVLTFTLPLSLGVSIAAAVLGAASVWVRFKNTVAEFMANAG